MVAFGGRALTEEDQPKYLNTAETPVFHKSSTLYALHLASQSMVGKSRAIVTEGYFDTIACHLAGFTETVATLGTALGEEHVQMLRRLAERVYLVFDADSAGVNAALRSQALFRTAGVDVRIVRLPAGHDQDTLLREQGANFVRHWGETGKAEVGIIGWGSTEGVIREATERARAEGFKVAHMHLRLLNPLNVAAINTFAARCRHLLVVELNWSGQLAGWIRANADVSFTAYHKDEGIPFVPNEIYGQVVSLAGK